jgi:DNA-binding LacI/PurR family transcriptional regulator
MPPVKKKQKRRKRGLITAYEVASLAGVSQSAVSRTFTFGASVSERTREKVMKAAKKLNYRPNLIARSLSTRRSDMVGVIVPPLENHFYPEMLEALSAELSRTGRRMLLFTSPRDSAVEPILDDVLNARVDALVMVAASVSSHFAEECQKIGLPIVLLNRKTDGKSVSSVVSSNHKGAETIAKFLIAGGHQRFAYIAGLESSSTNRDREETFVRVLAQHGHKLSAHGVGDYVFDRTAQVAREMLSAPQRPDAIFCANDHMALAFINVAKVEFNLAVGKDISVVGFDDAEQSRWPLFDLTTFAQPIPKMVEQVARIIDNQLAGAKEAPEVVVPGELVVRRSARLPKDGYSGSSTRRIWNPPSE